MVFTLHDLSKDIQEKIKEIVDFQIKNFCKSLAKIPNFSEAPFST